MVDSYREKGRATQRERESKKEANNGRKHFYIKQQIAKHELSQIHHTSKATHISMQSVKTTFPLIECVMDSISSSQARLALNSDELQPSPESCNQFKVIHSIALLAPIAELPLRDGEDVVGGLFKMGDLHIQVSKASFALIMKVLHCDI